MGYVGLTPEARRWTQFCIAVFLWGRYRIVVGEKKTMSKDRDHFL